MNYSFKIGDRVKIKSWGKMAHEYGINGLGNIKTPCHFISEMKEYCGKRAEVINIINRKAYQRVQLSIAIGYTIDNWMLEPDKNSINFMTYKERNRDWININI